MKTIENSPSGAPPPTPARALRVFLSYARADGDFAHGLRDRLIADGFDAYLDVQDIVKGEPWQERLLKLIVSADAILFLISPASVTSANCDWEVNQAERLGKRIVPVVALPTPLDDIPARLQRLNFAVLDTPASAATEYPRLLDALRQDAAWMREHTRLLELSTRWMEQGEPARLLLRGHDIDAGERWRDKRMPTAPEISPLHSAFLNASRHHASTVLRYWTAGLAGVVLSVSVLAMLALAQRNTAQSVALALRSDAVREAAPEKALALALAAYDDKATPDALGALRRSIDQTILLTARSGATRFKAPGGGQLAQWARSRDDARIVIGQGANTLLVLDGETLDERRRLDVQGGTPIAIAVSAHGRHVASADGSARVSLWSAGAGAQALAIVAPHEVKDIQFGPAESRLALIGDDDITFYSLQPLARLASVRYAVPGAHALDFAADDSLAVAIGFRNQGKVFDPATGEPRSVLDLTAEALRLKPFLGGSEASMMARGGFLDSGRILTSGGHAFWTLWDARSGAQIRQARTLTPGTGTDWTLADTASDLVVTEDGTSGRIFGWSIATGDMTHNFGDGHRNLIEGAALSPDARTVATLGADGKLMLWSVPEQRRLGSWSVSGRFAGVGFTPSGRRLATLTHAGEVALWDALPVVAQGRLEWDESKQALPFYETRFADDAARLVSFSPDKRVAIWNVGRPQPHCTPPGMDQLSHAALSNDGRLLATASKDGVLRVWSVAQCRQLAAHPGRFEHVSFNATATAIVANNYEGTVRVVAVDDGHLISQARFAQSLTNSAVFTRDGRRFAVMGNDGSAIIAATADGKELSRVTLPGMPFRRGVFAADGNRLFTTHDDNIVRSWDIRTGRLLAELRGAAGRVPGMRLLAGDSLLLAASDDGRTRLWQTADGALVRLFEGTSTAATDAVFAGGQVSVVDTTGGVTTHRCAACLAESDLVATARDRLARAGSMQPPAVARPR